MTPQRPCKRQRTVNPIITKYPVPPTSTSVISNSQQLSFPQRGSTYPPPNHNLQPYNGPPTPLPASRNPLSHWQQPSWLPNPPIPYRSQPWSSQGSPSSTIAPDSHRTSPISSADLGSQYNSIPAQNNVLQYSPCRTPLTRHGSLDEWSKRPRQESTVQNPVLRVTCDDLHNQYQQPEPSKQDVDGHPAGESWWDELRGLDYPEGSYDSKYVGEYLQT